MAQRSVTKSKVTETTIDTSAVEQAVTKLQQLEINLLAIDFDQTFIDIHTGGRWPGTVHELLPHVRPEFKKLVSAVMTDDATTECHVSIVTFSSQPQLIKGVLEQTLGVEKANKIPIRGGDRSWTYCGNGSQDGKQAHIASAVEELISTNNDLNITKATTLLIDDDRKNVRCALQDGTRAIWFNPEKPHLLLQDIAKLV